MTTKTPPVPRLRKLLLKFYQENDPVVLNQGFDINGLVKFTSEKGIDVVNRMLFKKYGKAIDVNEDLGSAKQAFNRMSQALTTSTVIVKKEQEFRQKLFKYFSQHNPSLTQPGQAKQFETMVKFAMLNGLNKLSDKLQQRYGAAIEGAEIVVQEHIEVDVNAQEFGNNNQNDFQLDIPRLRADLELFYTEMEDDEQLEVLDEMTDWACQIGIKEFDKKLQQLYGQSLNQFNESVGKAPHRNKGEEVKAPPPPTMEELPPAPVERQAPPTPVHREAPPPPVPAEEPATRTVYEVVREVTTERGIERPFEQMSDAEITDELRAFYKRHDPDNLGNLPKVLEVARRMGRQALNNNLYQIYEDTLQPMPVERVIERKVARQVPVVQEQQHTIRPPAAVEPERRAVPTIPKKLPAIPAKNSPTMPQQRPMPTFSPPQPRPNITMPQQRAMPTFGGAGGGGGMGNLMNDLANKISKPRTNVDAALQKQRADEERQKQEKKNHMPEFMRKALKAQERTRKGESIVSDSQGNKTTVNLLIAVCKNYELDPFAGVCKSCGFAVTDHFYGFKKEGW